MKRLFTFLVMLSVFIAPLPGSAMMVLSSTELDNVTGKAGFAGGGKTTPQEQDGASHRTFAVNDIISNGAAEMLAGVAEDGGDPLAALPRRGGVSIYLSGPQVIEVSFDSISWGDPDGIVGARNPGYIVLQPLP
ncbi:MAG: hypothetical protein SWH61_09780 [Thermodesulfobacteriota bacterium]|nr:hypothetical protein [Thermodesulfobacteriota bacterium]